jgi:hypothetical protein
MPEAAAKLVAGSKPAKTSATSTWLTGASVTGGFSLWRGVAGAGVCSSRLSELSGAYQA